MHSLLAIPSVPLPGVLFADNEEGQKTAQIVLIVQVSIVIGISWGGERDSGRSIPQVEIAKGIESTHGLDAQPTTHYSPAH